MKKNRYVGVFNWRGEIFEIWKHAQNKRGAWILMIKELSKELGIYGYTLRQEFNGVRNNYKIKKKERIENE